MYAQVKESVVSHLLFRSLVSCGMPLWSVEEWRARIGSSWAALGRPVGCSSHCKQRRHYVCCPLSGGGGGMVVSTTPTMTNVTLLMLSVSLVIVLPLEAGSSPLLHSELVGRIIKVSKIKYHTCTCMYVYLWYGVGRVNNNMTALL